jgi:hypothetical protein
MLANLSYPFWAAASAKTALSTSPREKTDISDDASEKEKKDKDHWHHFL